MREPRNNGTCCPWTASGTVRVFEEYIDNEAQETQKTGARLVEFAAHRVERSTHDDSKIITGYYTHSGE